MATIHPEETQARFAAQMQKAMESRAVIEQAKGIMMGDRRCTPAAAFAILSRLSQDTDRTPRDVVTALVTRHRNHGGDSGDARAPRLRLTVRGGGHRPIARPSGTRKSTPEGPRPTTFISTTAARDHGPAPHRLTLFADRESHAFGR